MQTKEQIERAFRADLRSLLDKIRRGAWPDHWRGYAECGEDVRMTVTIEGKWDKDGGRCMNNEIDLGATASMFRTELCGRRQRVRTNDELGGL